MMGMLLFLTKCGKEPVTKPNNDSLRFVLQMQDKQIGLLLNEVQAANDARVKAENKLADRKPIYVTRTITIHDQAPDTCKPYIAAVMAECDTMQMMYDTVITNLHNEVAMYDTTVKALQANKETLQHFNDKLEAEVKVADKRAKRAQFVSKLVTWSALVLVGVVTVVTMVE